MVVCEEWPYPCFDKCSFQPVSISLWAEWVSVTKITYITEYNMFDDKHLSSIYLATHSKPLFSWITPVP